jgi:hypothetical protein
MHKLYPPHRGNPFDPLDTRLDDNIVSRIRATAFALIPFVGRWRYVPRFCNTRRLIVGLPGAAGLRGRVPS